MNLNVLLPSLVTCFADLFCTVSPTPSISWYLPAKEICSDHRTLGGHYFQARLLLRDSSDNDNG